MADPEKPEELLLRIMREFLKAAYSLFALVATGFIVLGKFAFDALYKIVEKNRQGHNPRKQVECQAPNDRS